MTRDDLKTVAPDQARLIEACLDLDPVQLDFVLHYAEKILAGEDVSLEEAAEAWKAWKEMKQA